MYHVVVLMEIYCRFTINRLFPFQYTCLASSKDARLPSSRKWPGMNSRCYKKGISCLQRVKAESRTHPACHETGNEVFSPEVKRSVSKMDHWDTI